jgi:hypothetical protein
MWLGEPALILAISTAVLGVLFAIRRILARAPVETSSDRTASDVREVPWHCRGHCPTTADLFGLPRACSRPGGHHSDADCGLVSLCSVCGRHGAFRDRTRHRHRRHTASACFQYQHLDRSACNGTGGRRHLQLVAQPALSGYDARVCRACDCGRKRLGHHASRPITRRDEHRRHFQGRAVPRARVWRCIPRV